MMSIGKYVTNIIMSYINLWDSPKPNCQRASCLVMCYAELQAAHAPCIYVFTSIVKIRMYIQGNILFYLACHGCRVLKFRADNVFTTRKQEYRVTRMVMEGFMVISDLQFRLSISL